MSKMPLKKVSLRKTPLFAAAISLGLLAPLAGDNLLGVPVEPAFHVSHDIAINPDDWQSLASAVNARAEEFGGNVGYVDGTLLHLWHGTLEDRQYVERVDGLARFAFDPYTDLAIDGAGAWRWNSDKPAMHAYVRDYFSLRREDG